MRVQDDEVPTFPLTLRRFIAAQVPWKIMPPILQATAEREISPGELAALKSRRL